MKGIYLIVLLGYGISVIVEASSSNNEANPSEQFNDQLLPETDAQHSDHGQYHFWDLLTREDQPSHHQSSESLSQDHPPLLNFWEPEGEFVYPYNEGHDYSIGQSSSSMDYSGQQDLQLSASNKKDGRVSKEGGPYRPSLPRHSWVHGLLPYQIKEINDRFWDSWPKNITGKEKINRHIYNVSKYLSRHPDTVQRLVQGDKMTWDLVIARSMLDPKKERRRRAPSIGLKQDSKFHPGWLAKPIWKSKLDLIISNLRRHWIGADRTKVMSRLNEYTKLYGKIQSPESLFLNIDHPDFKIAADAIFCESAFRGQRHVGASRSDILHQYSEEYSVTIAGEDNIVEHVPRTSALIRPDSARFQSGEEWMGQRTLEEIEMIHQKIRKYWKEKLDNRVLMPAYLAVNKFLQENQGYITRIMQEDEDAAYFVATQTMKRKFMQRI